MKLGEREGDGEGCAASHRQTHGHCSCAGIRLRVVVCPDGEWAVSVGRVEGVLSVP